MSRYVKGYEFISYFTKVYMLKYDERPSINKLARRSDATIVAEELGTRTWKKLIDFDFETKSSNKHKFDTLLYNYDKYLKSYEAVKKDREKRKRLLANTKKRVEE